MSFEQYLKGFWRYILVFQYFGVLDELLGFPSFRFCVYGTKQKPGNDRKSLFSGL